MVMRLRLILMYVAFGYSSCTSIYATFFDPCQEKVNIFTKKTKMKDWEKIAKIIENDCQPHLEANPKLIHMYRAMERVYSQQAALRKLAGK